MSDYEVGSLVHCRERDWVVMPSEQLDMLLLRPLGGSEQEIIGIYLPVQRALRIDSLVAATFPSPNPAQAGNFTSGQLLRDATRLTFRSGAGPFRSLGRISVRPRPFQLVPLLMALRLDPVRLLIADDVGIGKTIEAALIARELRDRGEARRLCVICPPHLCEQWQRELKEKFALDAVVVRSGTVARLERTLPPGDISIFEHYPVMVVSIDFVKADRRRDSFVRGCPELVIVDEVHTAARAAGGRTTQQRHELLVELASNPQRHLLLLTATPHSGVEDAFRSLLALLDPDFSTLDLNHLKEAERRRLARHFVQRRRADVQQWLGESTPFPTRETREIDYSLQQSPEYRKLFDDIYRFARDLVRNERGDTAWTRRVRYWAALALLRCVMSSPAAAEATLRARIGRLTEAQETQENDQLLASYVLDLGEQENPQDFEPTPVIEESSTLMPPSERHRLQGFIRRATALRGAGDPKAAAATRGVETMLREGFSPIIYCRYIATATYLAAELEHRLRGTFPDLHVIAVTGNSSEEEREQRVAELASNPVRVLVATDCLSEGINLQAAFNAVLHYDLPWNPNRLEQREGRVDRYGQPAPTVRTTLLYGTDNPIDQSVLSVLLRKAVSIHRTLGISVPLPVDSESVVETVVRSLFQEHVEQLGLGLYSDDPPIDVTDLHQQWDRAAEREKQSRTRFAQHAIKPEEVAQELTETDMVLGNAATVTAFVRGACERLGEPLQPQRGDTFTLTFANLPYVVRERVGTAFMTGRDQRTPTTVTIGFAPPLPEGCHLIGRLHPLTEALAEYLLDTALDPGDTPPPAARSGVIRTTSVTRRTTLLLLRLRLLMSTAKQSVPTLAEELIVTGFEGRPDNLTWLDEETARRLLNEAEPAGNIEPDQRTEELERSLAFLPQLQHDLEAIAAARAAAQHAAHDRVRQVTRTGAVRVRPHLPLDVLGLYVLVPRPRGLL